MFRVARPSAVLLVGVLTVASLTACTPNVVSPAMSWLTGQDGVAQAELVVDRTTMFGTSGVIRGELRPDLGAGRLDALVQRAVDYVRDHDGVEFRLGYDDVDFLIQDADSTAAGRKLWDEVRRLDGPVSALAADGDVLVRVLRPEARGTLEALNELPAAIQLEAFRTLEAEESDRREDDYGPRQNRDGAVSIARGAGCDPSDDAWERALLATDDAVESGNVEVCGPYTLEYVPESDLVAVALEWADRQASSNDPAPELTVTEDDLNGRVIQVTPGDPTLFPAVAGFEAPGAPEVYYELSADATLEVFGYETATSDLVGILAASPVADRLSSIYVEGNWPGPVGGESVIVRGTIGELAGLVAEVESLFPLDAAFYNITADAGNLRVDLYSAPGSHPDMAAAAVALESSPLWRERFTVVGYLQAEIHIRDGVASLAADGYQHAEVLRVFVDTWNQG